jgi:hypothetical protein
MGCEVLPMIKVAKKGAWLGIEQETLQVDPARKVKPTGKSLAEN